MKEKMKMTDYKPINEDLIKITKYEVLSPLADPFIFDDGHRLTSREEWDARRKEIYKSAIELQFGPTIPDPEFLEIQPINFSKKGTPSSYRITTGTRKNPVSFVMYIFKAVSDKPSSAVITGDLCFKMLFDREWTSRFTDNGINLVAFNRCELAPDVAGYDVNALDKSTGEYKIAKEYWDHIRETDCGGQLKATYPDIDFSTTMAWAWGYSRCVDALEQLGITDLDATVFTGLSRGAKTCALAGALDERAAIVNPCATCMGAYSSYRINIEAITEDGEVKSSEPLSNIFFHFPQWMGRGMKDYIGKEETLPFDSHHFKAMIAPRVLFVAEAASDIWANPVGSWQTTLAAAEVYKMLGCEENLFWYFRTGYHAQTLEDVDMLINVIKHKTDGEPISDKFFKTPFRPMPLAYSWKSPI